MPPPKALPPFPEITESAISMSPAASFPTAAKAETLSDTLESTILIVPRLPTAFDPADELRSTEPRSRSISPRFTIADPALSVSSLSITVAVPFDSIPVALSDTVLALTEIWPPFQTPVPVFCVTVTATSARSPRLRMPAARSGSTDSGGGCPPVTVRRRSSATTSRTRNTSCRLRASTVSCSSPSRITSLSTTRTSEVATVVGPAQSKVCGPPPAAIASRMPCSVQGNSAAVAKGGDAAPSARQVRTRKAILGIRIRPPLLRQRRFECQRVQCKRGAENRSDASRGGRKASSASRPRAPPAPRGCSAATRGPAFP